MTRNMSHGQYLKLGYLLSMVVFALWLAGGCGERQVEPISSGPAAPSTKSGQKTLLVYCGNSMRPAIEQLAQTFSAERGVEVESTFADSGQLLIMIQETGKGDLYICHDPFGGAAKVKGLARKTFTIAYLVPIIAVGKGNPKGVHSMKDLAKPGVRVGLTLKEYSTAGHIVTFVLEKAGIATEVEKNVVLRTRTGGEVGNALKLGTIDAGIIWDAVAYRYGDLLETVPLDEEYRPRLGVDAVSTATYGKIELAAVKVFAQSLTCSKHPELADEFAAFVASDQGKTVFKKYGFTVAQQAE